MSGKGSELNTQLPPLPTLASTPEQAAARKLAQEARDAQVRGVASIAAMR